MTDADQNAEDEHDEGRVFGGVNWLWWVAGVVAVLVAVALLTTYESSGRSKAALDPADPSAPATLPPPDDGDISVVDHGFSYMDEPEKISFWAIVENSSDAVAQDTHGELTLVDEAGDALTSDPIEVTVHTVMPNDQMALAQDIWVNDMDSGELGDVEDVTLELVEPEFWRNVDPLVEDIAAPELVGDVSIEPGTGDSDRAVVEFTVGEKGTQGAYYDVNAIFRDSDSTIVGTCYEERDSLMVGNPATLTECRIPDGAVEDETEIYSDVILSSFDELPGND